MRIARLLPLLALVTGSGLHAAAAREHDFDFLNGTWDVHHHYLRITAQRREWLDYDGECVHRGLTGDWANMDEYLLSKPTGTYHAAALRAYDPAKDEWTIWWLDQRYPAGPLDPPMKGRFQNAVGTFYSDYVAADGKPHRTRFIWSRITAVSAHWEQSDSADGGKTWETNWVMDFKRRAAP